MSSYAGIHVLIWGTPECAPDKLGAALARRGFQVRPVDSLEPSATGGGFLSGDEVIPWEDVGLIVARLCG